MTPMPIHRAANSGEAGLLADRHSSWCLAGWAGVVCVLLVMLGFGGSTLHGFGAGALFAGYAALALAMRRRLAWTLALVIGWGLTYPYWRSGVLDLSGFIGDLFIPDEEPDNAVLRLVFGHAPLLIVCGLCGVGTATVLWITTRSSAVAAWVITVSLAIEPFAAGRSDVNLTLSGIVITDRTYGPFKTGVDSAAFAFWHVVVSGAIFRWAGRWHWPRRVRPGRCGQCGYDLRGLQIGVCPECGTAAGDTP